MAVAWFMVLIVVWMVSVLSEGRPKILSAWAARVEPCVYGVVRQLCVVISQMGLEDLS